jgi:4-diphosphocytidyl-2-C-methyl-D-erythritol kinase
LAAIVSGSGPTCAFLAVDEAAAINLAAALPASGACRAVRRAHGPVAGAKLVSGADL